MKGKIVRNRKKIKMIDFSFWFFLLLVKKTNHNKETNVVDDSIKCLQIKHFYICGTPKGFAGALNKIERSMNRRSSIEKNIERLKASRGPR